MVTTVDEAAGFAARLLSLVEAASGHGLVLDEPSSDAEADEDLRRAIDAHDTAALYAVLVAGFSYQGITDATAQRFMEEHGTADWPAIARSLEQGRDLCPKLQGFETFVGCRYQKARKTCGNPAALPACPVAALPLRKGILNEQAFSLYLLIRDRCGGDLVAFIDQVLAVSECEPDPTTISREALIALLVAVRGVSRKLASMMLAWIMAATSDDRRHWRAVAASMVAVDSLVHNHLHRTGILSAYGAAHAYGTRCFGLSGCELVIRDLAARVSAIEGSIVSPRRLEHAVWRFCASRELARCNGRRINDDGACQLTDCPLWDGCGHVPLHPPRPQEASHDDTGNPAI